jgi:hypothetical protein
MHRTGWVVALAALFVAACGGKSDKAATRDVQAFLAAVQSGDPTAFEASIDRAKLRTHVGRQVADVARAAGLEVEGGPSEFALDRRINPGNIHLLAAGFPLMGPPGLEQVEAVLKPVDKQHVCVHDGSAEKRCVLLFQKQKADRQSQRKAAWRLVEMPAEHLTLDLGPPKQD